MTRYSTLVLSALIAAAGLTGAEAQTKGMMADDQEKGMMAGKGSPAGGGNMASNAGGHAQDRGMMRGGGMMSGGGMMMGKQMMFVLMDTDGDEKISLEEFQSVHQRMFKHLDQNDDGGLEMDELGMGGKPGSNGQ